MSPIVRELKHIRIELNLTRREIALRMGLTQSSQIQKWEDGEVGITLTNLEAWAKCLGYELDLHLIKEPANV